MRRSNALRAYAPTPRVLKADPTRKVLAVADRFRIPFAKIVFKAFEATRQQVDLHALETLFQQGDRHGIERYLSRPEVLLSKPLLRAATESVTSNLLLDTMEASGNATKCDFGDAVQYTNQPRQHGSDPNYEKYKKLPNFQTILSSTHGSVEIAHTGGELKYVARLKNGKNLGTFSTVENAQRAVANPSNWDMWKAPQSVGTTGQELTWKVPKETAKLLDTTLVDPAFKTLRIEKSVPRGVSGTKPISPAGLRRAKAFAQRATSEVERLRSEFPQLSSVQPKRLVLVGDGDSLPGTRYRGVYYNARDEIRIPVGDWSEREALPYNLGQGQWSMSQGSHSSLTSGKGVTFLHELGHHVHLEHFSYSQRLGWTKIWDEIDLKLGGQNWIATNLTRYAGANEKELFAESFAAYTHPEYSVGLNKRLPREIEEYMEKNIGKRTVANRLEIPTPRPQLHPILAPTPRPYEAPKVPKLPGAKSAPASPAQMDRVWELYQQKLTGNQIAKETGLNLLQVRGIIYRKTKLLKVIS